MGVLKYRPEIDGLRAVAVIPVVLFHAGFKHFDGGFVGVDVFFVISGYLITTIILTEMEQGTFTLVNFYERRCRRILPALFLIMLVSLVFAWLWLFPSDMKAFTQSLAAVATFSSNILFWHETGYWGGDNELIPLLHTWSLAVEEQYYILSPLFMLLMWKFRKRWIFGSFITIAAYSLILSHWGAYNKPTATFFLLPTRGWELAVGASIAYYLMYRKKNSHVQFSYQRPVDEFFGLVGLIMIAYSVYAFNNSTPFPSFYALVPTLGAGFIILFASPRTLVGQLLGSKLPVGIGLISYSTYLWHQPLFAFARHKAIGEPNNQLLAALTVMSLLLAYLTWRYVETPFRKKGNISKKSVFVLAATCSVAFVTIGITGRITNGFDGRTTTAGSTFNSLVEKRKVNQGLSNKCDVSFTLSAECRTSDNPEILIWGDSFAMHLVDGIMASNPDAKIIQMTKSRCGPFFDVSPVGRFIPAAWAEGCMDFNGKVREWLQTNNSVKYVVMASPFYLYVLDGYTLQFRNGDLTEASLDLAVGELKKTISELETMGLNPIIFSPPPANGVDIGRCLARAEWVGSNLSVCDFLRSEIIPKRSKVYSFLEYFEDRNFVVHLEDLICDSSDCKTSLGDTYVFRDKTHLSHEGSALLGETYDFYQIITNGNSAEGLIGKNNFD